MINTATKLPTTRFILRKSIATMIKVLYEGEIIKNSSELQRECGLSYPTTFYHVKLLRKAGIMDKDDYILTPKGYHIAELLIKLEEAILSGKGIFSQRLHPTRDITQRKF